MEGGDGGRCATTEVVQVDGAAQVFRFLLRQRKILQLERARAADQRSQSLREEEEVGEEDGLWRQPSRAVIDLDVAGRRGNVGREQDAAFGLRLFDGHAVERRDVQVHGTHNHRVIAGGVVVFDLAADVRGIGQHAAQPRVEGGLGGGAWGSGYASPGLHDRGGAGEEQQNAVREVESAARRVDDFRIGRAVSFRNRVQHPPGGREVATHDLEHGFRDRHVAQRVGVIVDDLHEFEDGGLIRAGRRQADAPVFAGGEVVVVERGAQRDAVHHVRSGNRLRGRVGGCQLVANDREAVAERLHEQIECRSCSPCSKRKPSSAFMLWP